MSLRCYCEIDKNAFLNNLKNLQDFLHGRKIIGIVKTNFYGHGSLQLAEWMQENGVDDFAVAALSEAIDLRKHSIKGTILILGYVEEQDLDLAYQNDCIVALSSLQQLKDFEDYYKKSGNRLKVEVKVDTGMNRIGIEADYSDEIIESIYGNPAIQINGTFSHLCTADSFAQKDCQQTLKQKEIFDGFLKRVKELNLNAGRTHLCASSGIMNYPEFDYDYVRPGFNLLGFTVGEVDEPYPRKPILSWYSKVEMIKTLHPGEGVSYGHTFIADREMRVATLSVGYGDGYPRRLSNKGYVMINGKRANIVGNICMDQMIVDVSDIDVKKEDIATLIGEGISANQLADLCDTIVDEIVCDINPRVNRYYTK